MKDDIFSEGLLDLLDLASMFSLKSAVGAVISRVWFNEDEDDDDDDDEVDDVRIFVRKSALASCDNDGRPPIST